MAAISFPQLAIASQNAKTLENHYFKLLALEQDLEFFKLAIAEKKHKTKIIQAE